MSVLVITKFAGDSATFRQGRSERTAEFQKVVDSARAQGCTHHQFGIGEDFALVVDEWESVEQFQQFFADPELQAFTPRRVPGPNRHRSSWPKPSP